ncbi:MAG: alginate export family protein [Xanthomonadales bacterium]|nr:alginate export family protein [Gammaproteobacteria bacterium]NNE06480.1 alginate export family protein [Xanthomonadales bacterium]NNL95930.1 alginate export family protein [Xanthomonadales bacterium]
MFRKSNWNLLRPAVAVLSAMAAVTPVCAAESISEAISEGKAKLDFRYRLEWVDQDPFAEDATASTLRARVNYTTADYQGVNFVVEFDYVAELFGDEYNAGGGNTPNSGQYPVVADPDGDDLNQAFIQYSHGDNRFRAGRQRIILDNARFVGNVGWRQNPQTYDGLSFVHEGDNGLAFTVAYIGNTNRIFGDDVPAGDHGHDTTLLNISKQFKNAGTLTAYHYGIENEDAAALSNQTIGLRFNGTRKMNERSFGYTFEYATQEDHANSPVNFSADYYRVDLSVGLGSATLYAGYESLEGDHLSGGKSFRTPLATLHAFNGWADKFLSTPDAGLEDGFIGLRGEAGKWSWNALYHDFSAQSGGVAFGTEIDASLSRKLGEHYGLLLKAARFDSDNPSFGDTTKLWVQLTASF